MGNKKENNFVLAIYVDNKFGVLTRVTSMFTRRGFNIDALTVGVTESPDYSRITISMSGDGYARAQMINQLRKLYNVKKVEILDENDSIERELLLIKVQARLSRDETGCRNFSGNCRPKGSVLT